MSVRLFSYSLKCKKNATPLSRAGMRRTIAPLRHGILLSIDVLSSSASRSALEGQHSTTSRAPPLDLWPATPLSLKVRWLFHSEGVEDYCWYGGYENPWGESSRSVCSCSPHDRSLAALVFHAGCWHASFGTEIAVTI